MSCYWLAPGDLIVNSDTHEIFVVIAIDVECSNFEGATAVILFSSSLCKVIRRYINSKEINSSYKKIKIS